MKLAFYGGSFDPPHLGHISAAKEAIRMLSPDKLLLVPAFDPPHKELSKASPNASQRLEMTRLAAGTLPNAEALDIEIKRGGRSFTSDTAVELRGMYPDAELYLLLGSDMLRGFESWHEFSRILELCNLIAFPRVPGEAEKLRAAAKRLSTLYGARVSVIEPETVDISSSELRKLLPERGGREYLSDEVYQHIIRNALYLAKPSLDWLREKASEYMEPKRIPHVLGTEREAKALALRWGEDPDSAREAAILHDITKKLTSYEQLKLCEEYGIILDDTEKRSEKLMHAKTGAALARKLFGARDEICEAVRWHTTGRADMTLLEKIVYLADYVEPNRRFEGLERLKTLAYEDIDKAMLLGLEMSIGDLRARGIPPHELSASALKYFTDIVSRQEV